MFQKGNRYSVGNNGGRPPYYETPEALQKECDAYFDWIKGERKTLENTTYDEKKDEFITTKTEYWERLPEPPTVTGLILFLGFADRSSIEDQAKRGIEFFHVITRARKKVEHGYELRLHEDKPQGAQFALKNMGWVDKIETGLTDKNGNDVKGLLNLPTEVLAQMEKLLNRSDENTAAD